MSGPTRPEEWGTGIPGIPSMWDSQPSAPGSVGHRGEPSAQAPAGPWAPAAGSLRDPSSTKAWRWGLGAAFLLLVTLGAGALGGGEESTSAVDPLGPRDVVAAPAEDGFSLPPPPPRMPPPPPPPGAPAAQPDRGSETTVARADGAGGLFGLPLGTSVVLRDVRTGSRLDVRPGAVTKQDGLVLVQVELSAELSPVSADVPPLVLRLPDGRQVEASHVRGDGPGAGMPALLAPGPAVLVELGFDAGSGEAALVLDAGTPLAGWAVPGSG